MPATAGLFGVFDSITPSGRQKVRATQEQKDLLRELAATARTQRGIAEGLFTSTEGLRSDALGQLTNYLRTGELPVSLQNLSQGLYTTGRQDLEQQFQNARNQIRNEIPVSGGQLGQALTDLSQARAGEVGRLRSDIQGRIEAPLRQSLFGTGITTAFGQPEVALSGLSGAAAGFGSAAGGFSDIATRSLNEQLTREQRHKEEAQQVGQMIAMGFGG